MEAPFLGRALEAKREKRSRAITEEILAYLRFVGEKIAPYANVSLEVLETLNLPAPPPRPKLLDMIDMVDQYGLPNPGTWYDQPIAFMADLEAARTGKWRYEQEMRDKDRMENRPVTTASVESA